MHNGMEYVLIGIMKRKKGSCDFLKFLFFKADHYLVCTVSKILKCTDEYNKRKRWQ